MKIWEQEVNQILDQEPLLDDPTMTNQAKNELLDIAKDFTPKFRVWLSEKDFNVHQNSLSLNNTLTLSMLHGNTFFIHQSLSDFQPDFIPEGTTDPYHYYGNILIYKPVRILAATRDTQFPGIATLYVTPLEMDANVKTYYLMMKFGFMKSYADYFKKVNGQCSEAFGVTFELNSRVLERTLPLSMRYLEKRLDEYDQHVCNKEYKPII